LRIDVITLFPAFFEPLTSQGVVRRAFEQQRIVLRLWPLRDFADDAYRRVDDRPFGGGPGMVMMAPPLERALAVIRADRRDPPGHEAPVALFTPAGVPLGQRRIEAMAAADGPGAGAIWICGRYEGIDQRFIDRHVDVAWSLGDFVLSGGEIPALALLDAIARLQPGVLHNERSHEQDSFGGGLLDCPHYTRPERLPGPVVDGAATDDPVPAVLLSGHHAEIAAWRRQQSLEITARCRPDLIEAARREGLLNASDEDWLARMAREDLKVRADRGGTRR
jgi:tRNA (guanine37-N1)-methyltransferase